MNWMPRFVLPDGAVVLPEQLSMIYVKSQKVVVDYPDGYGWAERDISDARTDRPTGLTDRNGTAIFERDILDGSHLVYWEEEESQFRVGNGSLIWHVEAGDSEITGMVPYSEEAPDASH